MKNSILTENMIELISENYLDVILNGNFSDTCIANLTSCFQDIMNYNVFQQNRNLIFPLISNHF